MSEVRYFFDVYDFRDSFVSVAKQLQVWQILLMTETISHK